ncbi:phage tail tape measure protein [Allobaculum mucilyticum]|uniref:phage tail tape measure protein n=2 Tax=Allobaculum mucilyticum TaxID=2834459 RepID=UPI001F602ABA|nr:phage tail tape measure protein [Allobaculum mucilyticum]UNT96670.1 phage tail tape measure protein [Allobaculum mucilyticum]
MAGNIKGITLEINGSTTKLVDALKAPIKQSRELQSSLKNVNAALKLDPKNVDLLNQKQQLLSKSIGSTKEELALLKEAQKQYVASGKDLTGTEYTELERKIATTQKALENLEAQQNNFNGSVQAMGIKLGEFGEKTEKVGTALLPVTAGVSAMAAGSVAAFNEIDEGYDIIITKTGATGEAAESLQKSMDSVFGSLPTSAADAGIAIGEVNTRFGLTGDSLEQLSSQFIQFAQINETDLNGAVGSVNKNLQIFGLGAEDAQGYLGLLTTQAQATGISVDDLMNSVQKNGPVFKEMGLSIDESVNLLAQFEKNGVNADSALAGLKKAQQNATAEGKTLSQSLGETMQAIKGASSETEALQIATELFGKKGALEMTQAIREGRFSVDDLSSSLDDFKGTVTDTFEGTQDAPDKLTTAMNNLKIAGKEIGETLLTALAPVFEKLVEAAKKLAEWFSNLSDGQKQMILVIGGLAAAIGPALIAIGKMSTGLSALIKYFGSVETMGGKLIAALGGISAPVIAAAAAVAALVAAFVHLWNTNEEFRTNIMEIWNSIVEAFQNFFQGIVDRLNALGFQFEDITEVLKTLWDGFCAFLAPVFEGAFQFIATTLETVLNVLTGLFDVFSGLFTGNWDLVWQGVKEVFEDVWNGIKDWFDNILNTMKDILDVVCGWFGTTWEDTWNGIKSFFEGIWDGITGFFSGAIEGIKTAASNAWNWISEKTQSVWNGIKDHIINPISDAWNKVSEVFGNIYNWIKDKIEGARDIVSHAIDAIKGFFNFEFHWPHIPLPHFSISGSINPLDWFDGGLPSIGIEWYAKAMPKGMILDGPTIFGMQNGRLLGGGESGKEVVVGAQSLMSMINDGIRNAMSLLAPVSREPSVIEFDYSSMERSLKSAMADSKVEVSLVVDGRILARQIVKPMDQELAKLNKVR